MDRGLLIRPWRLVTTGWPWRALAYLALVTVAGVLTWVSMSTVVLFPIWAAVWARTDRRMLRLVGRPVPPRDRDSGLLSWRDFVHVLVSAPLGVLGVLATAGLYYAVDAIIRAPIGPWALVAIGVVLLPVLVWVLTVVAVAVAGLNASILRPNTEKLEAQVGALRAASLRAQDELVLERRLLQQRLHDGAQLHLSVTATHLGLLELELHDLPDLPDRGKRAELAATVEAVRENLQAAMEDVRSAAHGLTPRVLLDDGLCAALRASTSRMAVDVDLRCQVPRLPEATETDLYLMLSEALANVVKHSGARRADVVVLRDGPDIVATVADDGVGGADPDGSGILGMAARAERLGGALTLTSRAGAGTAVTIRIPGGTP